MFMKKDEWPAQLPDLNPIDYRYSVWNLLTKQVYAGWTKKFTEQELKDKIKEKWDKISVAKILSPYPPE